MVSRVIETGQVNISWTNKERKTLSDFKRDTIQLKQES